MKLTIEIELEVNIYRRSNSDERGPFQEVDRIEVDMSDKELRKAVEAALWEQRADEIREAE